MFSIMTLDGVGRLADEIGGEGAVLFVVLYVMVREGRKRERVSPSQC
jgi:hypothetical protein